MVVSAPRIDTRLLRAARRLGRRPSSVADIHRSLGVYAEQIGVARPSYQQIRLIVNDARMRQAARRATTELLLDVELGTRPVTDLAQLLEE
jgi:hypothetical protein